MVIDIGGVRGFFSQAFIITLTDISKCDIRLVLRRYSGLGLDNSNIILCNVLLLLGLIEVYELWKNFPEEYRRLSQDCVRRAQRYSVDRVPPRFIRMLNEVVESWKGR